MHELAICGKRSRSFFVVRISLVLDERNRKVAKLTLSKRITRGEPAGIDRRREVMLGLGRLDARSAWFRFPSFHSIHELNKSEITNVAAAKQAASLFTQLYQGILLQTLAHNPIDLSILPGTHEPLTEEARKHLTALEGRVERLIRFAAMTSMAALREHGHGQRQIAEHFAGEEDSLDLHLN